MDRELDATQVDAALVLDPVWVTALHKRWGEMIDIAVWGDIALAQLGATPRLRKRLLELGERLKSLSARRDWIPHPRERLKSALAAAMGVRETLDMIGAMLTGLAPGADSTRLQAAHQEVCELIARELPAKENTWAQLLDAQVGD